LTRARAGSHPHQPALTSDPRDPDKGTMASPCAPRIWPLSSASSPQPLGLSRAPCVRRGRGQLCLERIPRQRNVIERTYRQQDQAPPAPHDPGSPSASSPLRRPGLFASTTIGGPIATRTGKLPVIPSGNSNAARSARTPPPHHPHPPPPPPPPPSPKRKKNPPPPPPPRPPRPEPRLFSFCLLSTQSLKESHG